MRRMRSRRMRRRWSGRRAGPVRSCAGHVAGAHPAAAASASPGLGRVAGAVLLAQIPQEQLVNFRLVSPREGERVKWGRKTLKQRLEGKREWRGAVSHRTAWTGLLLCLPASSKRSGRAEIVVLFIKIVPTLKCQKGKFVGAT